MSDFCNFVMKKKIGIYSSRLVCLRIVEESIKKDDNDGYTVDSQPCIMFE